jgi:hypothetical protein
VPISFAHCLLQSPAPPVRQAPLPQTPPPQGVLYRLIEQLAPPLHTAHALLAHTCAEQLSSAHSHAPLAQAPLLTQPTPTSALQLPLPSHVVDVPSLQPVSSVFLLTKVVVEQTPPLTVLHAAQLAGAQRLAEVQVPSLQRQEPERQSPSLEHTSPARATHLPALQVCVASLQPGVCPDAMSTQLTPSSVFLHVAQTSARQSPALHSSLPQAQRSLTHCMSLLHASPFSPRPEQLLPATQTLPPVRQRSAVPAVQVVKQVRETRSQRSPSLHTVLASQPQMPEPTSTGRSGSRRAQAASEVGSAAQAPSLLQ